jgi:hypothetical protein
MLSCTINAEEERDVATANLPGASFMQIDMEDTVHMMLEGKMAELLEKIDPELYRKYLLTNKGKSVMYVKLKKTLCGTLQATLLFWKKLSKRLKEWGFVINAYDWCVANKMIGDKQCTGLWHVDGIKVSHEDPNVVTEVLKRFDEIYTRKEAPLVFTHGKTHNYPGMTLTTLREGK